MLPAYTWLAFVPCSLAWSALPPLTQLLFATHLCSMARSLEPSSGKGRITNATWDYWIHGWRTHSACHVTACLSWHNCWVQIPPAWKCVPLPNHHPYSSFYHKLGGQFIISPDQTSLASPRPLLLGDYKWSLLSSHPSLEEKSPSLSLRLFFLFLPGSPTCTLHPADGSQPSLLTNQEPKGIRSLYPHLPYNTVYHGKESI